MLPRCSLLVLGFFLKICLHFFFSCNAIDTWKEKQRNYVMQRRSAGDQSRRHRCFVGHALNMRLLGCHRALLLYVSCTGFIILISTLNTLSFQSGLLIRPGLIKCLCGWYVCVCVLLPSSCLCALLSISCVYCVYAGTRA